ncbi:MAG: hypothetical protein AB1609_18960, partial [Bacillota bacterium]
GVRGAPTAPAWARERVARRTATCRPRGADTPEAVSGVGWGGKDGGSAMKGRHGPLRGVAGMPALPNVAGIGLGNKEIGGRVTGTPSIVVLVTRKVPRETLRARHLVPGRLGGAITDVVEVGELRPLT